MMKKLLLAGLFALIPGLALAQSSPGLRTGQVPTASQWNSYFALKQDVLGYTPLNIAGGTMLGELVTKASATNQAGFNVPPGVAPTSPVDGDIWTTGAGMFVRAGGVTVGPLSNTCGGCITTLTMTGDVTGTSSGSTLAATLATVNSTPGSFGSSTAIPSFTVDGKGRITTIATSAVIAPAGTLTGATLASNVLASSLTSVGTLTGGATGAGFTVALSTATVTGTLDVARLPAFTGGNVTSSAGSAVLTIGATQVTNAMLAGSIDLTTKVTGILPFANGGCNATSAAACLTAIGGVPLAGGTMTGLLILSADPATALGAATKGYVDSLANGIQNKGPTATATSANIALTGEQTINGVLTSGSTVLVKNQTLPEENGLYVTAAGAWTRATNLDTWTEAVGAYTFVNGGTLAGQSFTTQVSAGGTIGTTPMPWGLFNATTAYTAGAGLTLTGSQFSITTAGVTNAMLAGSITAAKLVGSDIVTVGTITSGTWRGTAVGTQWGGTGQDWSASSGIPLLTSGAATLLASTGSGNVVRNTSPTINALTVTGSFSAAGLVTNAALANPSLTLGVTTLTLGATSSTLTFANNNPIQWRNTGGTPINSLYLDASNVFQLGGGNNVAVAATQSSTGTGTGALQVAGGIYGGPHSFFQGGSNGTGTTFTINERTRGDSDTSFYVQAGTSAGDFVIKTNGLVGIGTTTPSGFGGNTLVVNTSTSGSGIRLIDAGISNASWAFLGSTGGSTPLFRIYNPAQGIDRLVIDGVGSIGLSGMQNPSIALEGGQGIAIGGAGGVGTIFVNPYVDSNATTSGLVVKLNDQPAAATYGGTGYEYALIGTIISTHNGGSLAPNKVGVQGSAQASGASSGNVWGGYFECQLDPGSSTNSFCIGTEIDANNYLADKTNDLAHPAYGLQITGASTFASTAALLLAGTTSQWARGIVAVNMRAGVTLYGIDLAYDTSNSFGASAIRLPNNQTIAWVRAGGGNLNGMYLDASDVFQVGGGLPVAMTGLGAIAQTNVVCYNSGTGLLTYQTWAAGCAVSSARYKRDITPIDPDRALNIASSMTAVTYRYRPEVDLGSDIHTGFTAENVAEADADLVVLDREGRPDAVKYQEIAPILAGAVQKLKSKNEALEEKVRGLEKAMQGR